MEAPVVSRAEGWGLVVEWVVTTPVIRTPRETPVGPGRPPPERDGPSPPGGTVTLGVSSPRDTDAPSAVVTRPGRPTTPPGPRRSTPSLPDPLLVGPVTLVRVPRTSPGQPFHPWSSNFSRIGRDSFPRNETTQRPRSLYSRSVTSTSCTVPGTPPPSRQG